MRRSNCKLPGQGIIHALRVLRTFARVLSYFTFFVRVVHAVRVSPTSCHTFVVRAQEVRGRDRPQRVLAQAQRDRGARGTAPHPRHQRWRQAERGGGRLSLCPLCHDSTIVMRRGGPCAASVDYRDYFWRPVSFDHLS